MYYASEQKVIEEGIELRRLILETINNLDPDMIMMDNLVSMDSKRAKGVPMRMVDYIIY